MLHFRNTYKTSKSMLFCLVISVLSLVLSVLSLLITVIPHLRTLGIVCCVVFFIIFCINFFIIFMKNNDYKFKYLINLNKFYKEFKSFKANYNGNPLLIKELKKQQKDYFLQYGELNIETPIFCHENNKWNEWIEDSNAFNYGYAEYAQKLSYLTYVLYTACVSGGGFEEFFRWIEGEPFTSDEIINVLSKNKFYSEELKKLLINIICEYDAEKQDILFARYEENENKLLYSFENEITSLAKWIAHNRLLLCSNLKMYIESNKNYKISKLFLSADYMNVVYIYQLDDKSYRMNREEWDETSLKWVGANDDCLSIYDSLDTCYNNVKHLLKGYIELYPQINIKV